MEDDVDVRVGDGSDLSLKLHAVELPTDPVRLSFVDDERGVHQSFKFSVESVNDSRDTEQDSGAYNMNVDRQGPGTDKLMVVKEVQVSHGMLSSRIDVFFL